MYSPTTSGTPIPGRVRTPFDEAPVRSPSRPSTHGPLRTIAWLPSRAWGALPVVAVMVTLLAWTSATDLVGSRAEITREAVHALQVAGFGCVWALSRRQPHSSVVLRIKSAA